MNGNLKQALEIFAGAFEADDEVKEYLNVKREYENDSRIMSKMNEYNVQNAILDGESEKAEKDTLLIDSVKKRRDDLYAEITADPKMISMIAAEEKLAAIFTEINHILQHIVAPGAGCGSGCGCGDCHGCG